MKLVRLNRERERREKRERDSAKAWLVNAARNAPMDIDGFGLVVYRNEPDGTITTRTNFFTRNTMDTARLPELARRELDHWGRKVTRPDPDDDD